MFVYLTPSHKEMFEKYFYPSFKKFIEPRGVTFEMEYGDQVCSSATYNGDGSHKLWEERLWEYYWQICVDTRINDIIMFVDADVIFLNDNIIDSTIKGLNSNDAMFARDKHFSISAGFQAYRISNVTKTFLEVARKILSYSKNDQVVLNKLKRRIDYKRYDWKDVYSIYHYNHKVWNGNSRIVIPSNISCFHANWTMGVENKMKFLSVIKNYLDI